MTRIKYRRYFRSLIAVVTIFASASNVCAKEIVTGAFGLWAVDNIEQTLQTLSQSNYKVVSGLEGRSSLDMCHKYGLKCLVGFRSGLTIDIASNDIKWNDYLAALKVYVSTLKTHPAVYAWYLVDEPDLFKIPRDKIKILVDTVRSVDPIHPIFTVLYAQTSEYRRYIQYFDIIGIEPYLKANDTNVDTVRKQISTIKTDLRLLKLRKKIFVVLGVFELKPRSSKSTPTLRKPTVAEFGEMVRICSGANVDGVLVFTLGLKNSPNFYDWNLATDNVDLWNAVKKMPAMLQ